MNIFSVCFLQYNTIFKKKGENIPNFIEYFLNLSGLVSSSGVKYSKNATAGIQRALKIQENLLEFWKAERYMAFVVWKHIR